MVSFKIQDLILISLRTRSTTDMAVVPQATARRLVRAQRRGDGAAAVIYKAFALPHESR